MKMEFSTLVLVLQNIKKKLKISSHIFFFFIIDVGISKNGLGEKYE